MLVSGEKRVVTASTCADPGADEKIVPRRGRLAVGRLRLHATSLPLSLALWGKPRNSIAFRLRKNVIPQGS